MRNFLQAVILASLLFSATAFAVPTIPAGGVVNSASYLPTGLPGDGIARGSMFAVFGSDLGPEELLNAPSLPLGTTLGGASISVTVNGVTRSAFMLFSSAGQLAAILPSSMPAGDGTLTVTFDGMTSAPAAIKVVDSRFGIFSRNQAGFGPGIVQNYLSEIDQPVNAIIDAAHPGQVVILWGTGLGPITGGETIDAGMPPVGNLPVTVEVWVGGKAAAVQYAGRSFGYAAIDQVNFAIPAGVTGCYVPVMVVVNGVASNYITIAVTDSGPYCSDFQTFLPGELETIVQDGQGGVGYVELSRYRGEVETPQGSMSVVVDDVAGKFSAFNVAEIVGMTPAREAVTPVGSCITALLRTVEGSRSDPIPGIGLNAGDELQLQGPQGTRPITGEGSSYQTSVGGGFGGDEALPEFFTPGMFVLSGGSAPSDIGAFEASVTIPESPQWTNQSSFATISRDQDLTVEWTGIDAATEYVVVQVQSINHDAGVAGIIHCSADPAAGSFTLPQRVLSTLPASSPWDGDSDPTGQIYVSGNSRNTTGTFTATGLVTGRLFYTNRVIRTTVVE